MISQFPLGFPDEHIASRVTRFHINSGNLSSAMTFEQLFGRSPFSLTTLSQPYLRQLADRLPGDVIENLQLIEEKSTLSPLFTQYYVGTEHTPELKSRTTRWIVGEKGLVKICPECLIADYAEHGWSYLHRTHQIPGITACWRHERSLLDRCPHCSCPYSMSRELVETAWHGCSCGLTTEDLATRPISKPEKVEHELAQFAHELLQAEPIILNRSQLTELYRRQAHALGMQYGKFRINRQLLIKRLITFFGRELLSRIDPAFRKNKGASWVQAFEERSNTESPLYRHVLLSFFLFGAYTTFHDKAKAIIQETVQTHDLVITTPPESDTPAKKIFRELEQAALRHNADINRLWISHTGSMRQLLKLDPAVFKQLEEKLRTMPRRRKSLVSKPIAKTKLADDDVLWSEAIEKAAKKLYGADDVPVRITKNRILTLVWSQLKKRKVLEPMAYPQACKMLESYAESQWHFYARRIVWLLQSLIDRETPGHVLRRISTLECHKFNAVLAYLSDCPRGTGASAQTVAAYLKERQISRDWEGPDPDRKFDNPGRIYRLRTSRKGEMGDLAPRPYTNHGDHAKKPAASASN